MVGNMWLGSVLGGRTGKNPGEILERRGWVASWEFKSEKMGGVKRVRGKVPGWGTPLWTCGWGVCTTITTVQALLPAMARASVNYYHSAEALL